MDEDRVTEDTQGQSAGWKRTAVLSVAILLAGAAVVAVIFSTEPTATREGATKKTAMLVDVVDARAGTFRPTITAMGSVRPARDIVLRTRVNGEVVEQAGDFVPGGFVEKGEVLVRLDQGDYRNALEQRKSELRQASADLRLEMGRQDVAEQEYELLERELSEENRELVLRNPQLNSARAQVESARAAVDQAELELQRTTIAAPFDAQVLERHVNTGSQVSTGDQLARLVGLDTYWVEASVPVAKLSRLSIPDGDKKGSAVRIRNRTAWPEGTYRNGRLYRLVGSLQENTRMARVLVSVKDPLAREPAAADRPVLMIGSYVESRIRGEPIEGVVRLNRDYMRKNDTVWVMKDGQLEIREVTVAFRDSDHAYIRDGLEGGDRVVTTNLSTVEDGARLRLEEGESRPKRESTQESDTDGAPSSGGGKQ